MTTIHLPDFDNRRDLRTGRGSDGPGDGGPGRGGGFPDTIDWLQFLATLGLVGALALRRTAPRVAYVGVLATMAMFLLAGGPYALVLLGPALAVHTLMTRYPPRQLLLLLLAVPVALSAGFWTRPYAGLDDPGLYLAVVLGTAGILLPGLIGLVLTTRRDARRRDAVAERRRHADEERLQIAREVHDVVGHSLAVINMQAGVALHLLEKRPDQLRPSLEAIRGTSKQALAELGSALATLRGDALADIPTGTVAVEPPTGSAGLAGLDNLVAALRAAGRTVYYTRPATDQLQLLPVAVQHAALRIAQEGLTNVVRHATPDAAITVSITSEDSLLVVEVLDDGRPGRSTPVEGSGIAGMRARARAVGGSVVVGPLPERGFRIRAELPAAKRPDTPTPAEPAEPAARP
ncbi:sensor histidine kinase [Friedmanniella luteola]|uniref:sensor histidine kinase n=1 Tax=Friedmanniella luteola TaxID=546871 RepID=UPI0012FE12BC|nr:histidine kinase [Friedmanniella luteola]